MKCPLENLCMTYVAKKGELTFRCEHCRYVKVYKMTKKPSAEERLELFISNIEIHSDIKRPERPSEAIKKLRARL